MEKLLPFLNKAILLTKINIKDHYDEYLSKNAKASHVITLMTS